VYLLFFHLLDYLILIWATPGGVTGNDVSV